MSPRTPEETFRRLLELLLAKDMDAVADLWAENGTAEFPFAEGASPRRLTGREAVRDYLAGYPDLMDVRAIPTLTVHHKDHASRLPGATGDQHAGHRVARERSESSSSGSVPAAEATASGFQ
ncbi:nuclear transport factor 2 family protein [Streptomyces geysiriensis]|uniref:nuclear transport factor 2 family protein n=1 Tax=Streptomyces geysiriensis TaxID=68207 RepID=UPI001C7CD1CD|nr:nuclear transport factor 2 family protein [Streptomyces geysiriensis]MBX4174170.1 nuclear transport factor 2 family protein [Streptomyces geysiriensis]